MLNWLIKGQIRSFERQYDYDMSYAREILESDPSAFRKFMKIMGMASYRKDAPRDAVCAASLVGTMAEDCGPCTQLVVTMAERDGVNPLVLSAILAGDTGAMGDSAALAYRFARASLAHDAEADILREQVVARWGKRALIALAFALTASRVFPTLKYALGHGRSCTRVRVGGTVQMVEQHQVS
jgi:hypothetical protein